MAFPLKLSSSTTFPPLPGCATHGFQADQIPCTTILVDSKLFNTHCGKIVVGGRIVPTESKWAGAQTSPPDFKKLSRESRRAGYGPRKVSSEIHAPAAVLGIS